MHAIKLLKHSRILRVLTQNDKLKKPEFRAEARNSGLSGSTVFDCSWGTLLGKSIMHFWQREAHWELTGGQF